MSVVDDVTRAVRETVAKEDDVQIVLNGYLVVETLDVDSDTPTLRHYRIGDTTPWAAAGMLHADRPRDGRRDRRRARDRR